MAADASHEELLETLGFSTPVERFVSEGEKTEEQLARVLENAPECAREALLGTENTVNGMSVLMDKIKAIVEARTDTISNRGAFEHVPDHVRVFIMLFVLAMVGDKELPKTCWAFWHTVLPLFGTHAALTHAIWNTVVSLYTRMWTIDKYKHPALYEAAKKFQAHINAVFQEKDVRWKNMSRLNVFAFLTAHMLELPCEDNVETLANLCLPEHNGTLQLVRVHVLKAWSHSAEHPGIPLFASNTEQWLQMVLGDWTHEQLRLMLCCKGTLFRQLSLPREIAKRVARQVFMPVGRLAVPRFKAAFDLLGQAYLSRVTLEKKKNKRVSSDDVKRFKNEAQEWLDGSLWSITEAAAQECFRSIEEGGGDMA